MKYHETVINDFLNRFGITPNKKNKDKTKNWKLTTKQLFDLLDMYAAWRYSQDAKMHTSIKNELEHVRFHLKTDIRNKFKTFLEEKNKLINKYYGNN